MENRRGRPRPGNEPGGKPESNGKGPGPDVSGPNLNGRAKTPGSKRNTKASLESQKGATRYETLTNRNTVAGTEGTTPINGKTNNAMEGEPRMSKATMESKPATKTKSKTKTKVVSNGAHELDVEAGEPALGIRIFEFHRRIRDVGANGQRAGADKAESAVAIVVTARGGEETDREKQRKKLQKSLGHGVFPPEVVHRRSGAPERVTEAMRNRRSAPPTAVRGSKHRPARGVP